MTALVRSLFAETSPTFFHNSYFTLGGDRRAQSTAFDTTRIDKCETPH